MKNAKLQLGVLCCIGMLIAIPATAQDITSSQLHDVDSLVNVTLQKWNTPGVAISVVKDGKVVLSKGYGVRDPRNPAPVTKDTYFPLASLVKAFTSLGVGILVDEGKMEFDGTVRSYIPGFQMHDDVATMEVTIRDLLSHRSGLRGRHDGAYYRNPQMTREELVRRFAYFDLFARPRTAYSYSNAAYVAVGLAMEKAAGVSYERFIQDRVFAPLGMTRTTFSASEAKADSNHVVGRWMWNGTPVYEYFDGGPIINSHGGISSTADDMAKWMLLNLSAGSFGGKQIIKAATLKEVHRTQIAHVFYEPEKTVSVGYAMGWNTEVYRGEYSVWHTGGVPGIYAITRLIPARNLGVTILANDDSGIPFELSLEIMDRLLGVEPMDRLNPQLAKDRAREAAARASAPAPTRPETPPPHSHKLSDYAGTYVHPGYGEFVVRLADGHLVAEYNGHTSPLVHRHYDVFRAQAESPFSIVNGNVQFFTDTAGEITRLVYSQFAPSAFERVKVPK